MSAVVLLMLAMVLVVSTAQPVRAAPTPELLTDESMYSPNSTVTIRGYYFVALAPVHISVVDPAGGDTSWSVASDALGSFSTAYQLGTLYGDYTATAYDGFNAPVSTTFYDPSGPSANLDQCRNGGVGATPVPCNPITTSPLGWVNGNAQGQQAHWREGESISYRTNVSGLTAGSTYALDFHYDTVHSAKHAIDYLTSYDVTETTSPTPSAFHANNNNPCSDFLSTANCVPASPASSFLIPDPTLLSCGGSAGVFSGTLVADRYIKAYGPSGTVITNVAYLAENVPSGSGQCSTDIRVTFTAGGPIVGLAWGGHIASQADWGFSNSASAISGSPYHMSLDKLNGASTGSQDRALATSAIFFTPTITTTIYNAATNLPIAGTPPTAPAGTTVYDTATLSAISPVAGGTVYYAFFTNGACSGTPSTNESVAVTNAAVPNSPDHGPLSAGSYSFQAYYSGDPTNNVYPAVSACEPLTIQSVSPTITTTVSPSSITLGAAPASATDTATISGGVNPTGSLVFTVYYNDATCSAGSLVFTSSTIPVSGDGTYTSAPAFTPDAAGTYYWIASYGGDLNNQPASTACGDSGETLVVNKAPPTLVTSPSPASQTLTTGAQGVTDTATLSGGFNPTGTLTFEVFRVAGGACSGGALATSTATVSGNGAYYSSPFTPTGVGTYVFVVTYSGDGNNLAVGPTSCGDATEQFTVSPAEPTVTTSIVSSVVVNNPVTDSATLSGAFQPTGTISFYVAGPFADLASPDCSGATLLSTATVTGNGDYTSAAFTPTLTGYYQFYAVYSGDSNNDGAQSACGAEPLQVTPQGTTLTTSIVASVVVNHPVVDTATLSGGFSPAGTISFYVAGPFADLASSSCAGAVLLSTATVSGNGDYDSAPFTPTLTGYYQFYALYSGDGNNQGSESACGSEPLHVLPQTTLVTTFLTPSTLTLGPSPVSAYDTATLSGGFNPSGLITFTVYGDDLCTALEATYAVPVNGNGNYASPAFTPAAAGTYYWIASYSGDGNNLPYTTACGDSGEVLTVSPAPPTMTTSVSPASFRLTASSQPVTDTASLSGGFAPTGSITFYVYFNDASCGAGNLVFTSSAVPVNGNGDYTSAPAFVPDAAGTYYWVASYTGDSNNVGFTTGCGDSGETLVVEPAQPDVTTAVSQSEIILGDATFTVTDTATLSGAFDPTGTITFTVFNAAGCTGTPLFTSVKTVSGNGDYTSDPYTIPGVGTYYWVAAYSGDSNNNPFTTKCGEANEVVHVSPANPSVTTVASPSQFQLTTTSTPATDTATLSGGFAPTGFLTFYLYFDDASCEAASLVFTSLAISVTGNGAYTSTPTYTPTAAGTYYWIAAYSGDANNKAYTTHCGESGEVLTVLPASPGVTTVVSPSSIVLADGVFTATDTATLSGGFAPTGTITFTVFDAAGCTGSPIFTSTVAVGGNGDYTSAPFTVPGVGTYYWIADYSGDSNNNPYASSCGDQGEVLTVTAASPSVVTSVTPSTIVLGDAPPYTAFDTAYLAGAFSPTGSIAFTVYFDDATCTAAPVFTSTVPVSGNGAYPSGTLTVTAAGTYYWIAAYSGDGNNDPFTTKCGDNGEVLTVELASPSVTTLVSPQTITLGSTPPYTATDTASLSGGFNPTGEITFTVFDTVGCTGNPLFTSTVPVSGNGDYTSGPFTVPGAGTYFWIAAYSGDANNDPFTTACGEKGETLTVLSASPGVTTEVSPSSIVLGPSPPYTAVDTATLSGGFAPTGTIAFTVYGDALCSGPVLFTSFVSVNGNGAYTSDSFTVPGVGTYYWIADYSGDGNNHPYASSCGDQGEVLTVTQAPPTVTTALSQESIVLADATFTVTDTATLSGGFSPTGAILFTVFDTAGCTGSPIFTSTKTVSGNGAYTSAPFTVPGVGTYSWIASYSGDANNEPYATSCGDAHEVLTVTPASPGVTTQVSPSSITLSDGVFTATDTATLTGGFDPTGSITFSVYGDALCSGPVLFTSTVLVAGNGAYTSAAFTVPGAGTYFWIADYSGDLNNQPFASGCGDNGEVLTVAPASPGVTTALTPESIVLGDAPPYTAFDTAFLTGAFEPTGAITFTVFDTASCTGSPLFSDAVPVSGNGAYPSAPFTVPGTGTYYWIASYSGDANNNAFTTKCGDAHEVLTVTSASPTVTTAVYPADIVLTDGTSTATDTAFLSGGYAPRGTITFTVFDTAACAGSPIFTSTVAVIGNGAYTSDPFTVPGVGTYYWIAAYSGDLNNNPFTTSCGDQGEVLTVSAASPTITTAVSSESILLGDATYTVTDTATLSGGFVPTGTITFTVFDTVGCTGNPLFTDVVSVGGNGAYTSAAFTIPGAGTYYWIAAYSGDGNNNPFATGCGDAHEVVTVLPALPGVTTAVSAESITLGDSTYAVTDTATLSGGFAPTGTITFTVYGDTLCAGPVLFTSVVPVSGNGDYTSAAFTIPGVGTYYWIAAYSGDGNNDPYTTGCGDAHEVVTVFPASPGVTTAVSPASITLGDGIYAAADTATLAGGFAPTGTITFTVFDSDTCTGTPLFTSVKTVDGNGDYTSDAFTVPGVGTYYWIADYSGDPNNMPFASGCGDKGEVLTVLPASPGVVTQVSSESITLGDATFTVTDTATLSGGFAPTGTMTFTVFDDASCSGSPLFTSVVPVLGNGAYTSDPFTIPGAGTYYWVAAYSGDANNGPYTTTCGDAHEVVTVLPALPGVTTAVSAESITLGDSTYAVTDTATLSGGFAPTGTMTFTVFDTLGCTGVPLFTSDVPVLGNGDYTSDAFTIPGTGTYSWIAVYSGDGNNNAFSTSCGDAHEVVKVSPASPSVVTAVSVESITLGDSTFTVTDTASLSGGFAPTGAIVFSVYGDGLCAGPLLFASTVLVSGNGAYTSDAFTIPGVGVYYWIASYSGDANNHPFTTGCGDAHEVVRVAQAPPTVTTAVSDESIKLGDATFQVTDTATLSGGFAPTGSITFTVFETAGCSGQALFTSDVPVFGNGAYTSAPFTVPGAGTYSWIAAYSGDANNLPFATGCGDAHEVLTVLPASPGVTTAVSAESITLTDATFTVTDTATLTGGFAPTGTMGFSVYGDALCSGPVLFTSTVLVAGNGAYTSGAFTVLGVGTYYWVASYSGDGNNDPFTTGCGDAHEVVTVSPTAPDVTTRVSPASIVLGDGIYTATDTAILTGGFAPTGTITFTVFDNGACTGSPLFTSDVPVFGNGDYTSDAFTVPGVGSYYWIAHYSGDANNGPFTTKCGDAGEIVTVTPASPGVTTVADPFAITLGDQVSTATDTAFLTGGFEPTGSMTFTVYGDGLCAGPVLFTSAKTVIGNGAYTSHAFTVPGAGTYYWVAAYSGDTNNDAFTTGCGDKGEVLMVSPASPRMTTQLSFESITLSDGVFTVTDTATLTGGFEPTGSIAFTVFANDACTGSPVFTSTAPVNGNSMYTSAPFTVPGVGTYSWIAAYSGDSNNVPFTTGCGDAHEVLTVLPASPLVVTAVDPASITLGDHVSTATDTAFLSGGFEPTGTIAFSVYGDGLCAGPVLFTSTALVAGNGAYTSAAFTIPGAGTYFWIASYSGDPNNNAFTTKCGDADEVVTVAKAPPTVVTAVSSESVTLGDASSSVTDTASLAGGFAPTGTVSFTVFDTAGCTGNPLFTSVKTVDGNGDYTSDAFTIPSAGTYYWVASYSGDANNLPYTTACGEAGEVVTVSPASPGVVTAVSAESITLGDATFTVTDTATLSGGFAPTGAILFSVYGDGLCLGPVLFTSTKSVSGNGAYTSDAFTIPGVGTYYWIAAYSGDGNNNPFTTACGDAHEVVTVAKAPPSVSTVTAPASIVLADGVFTATDTATLSGGFAPTGTIIFTVFDTAGCTGIPLFTDVVTVAGDGAYTSGPFTVPGVGIYSWIADYSGDGNNLPYTTACGEAGEVVTVLPASPRVATEVSSAAITLGDSTFSVTDTASLSGAFEPTGTMTFTVFDSAGCSDSPLFTSVVPVSGNGFYTSGAFTIPSAGTYFWIAAYSGDANNDPFMTGCGDNNEVVTVSPASPEVVTQVSAESVTLADAAFSVTDTASLSGGFEPTGTITFSLFSSAGCVGSPLFTSVKTVDGNGDYTSDAFTIPGTGTYSWIAAYSGDGNNAPFSTSCGDAHEVVKVSSASPTVVTAVSTAAITLGDSAFTVTDTALLSGGFEPTGTIAFSVYGDGLCAGPVLFASTVSVSGNGAYTSDAFTIPGAGTYYWIASYSGDANNNPFTTLCGDADEVVTVAKAPPRVTTAVSVESITLGDGVSTVTDTATLTGGFAPTGTLVFSVFDSGTCNGNVLFSSTKTVSGNGAYTSGPFTIPGAGTYYWVAAYSGDGNNDAFTTGCGDAHEVVTVLPAQPGVVTALSEESIVLTDATFTVTDTATLSGGFAPTGDLTFSVFDTAGCTESPIFTNTKAVNGNGAHTSDPFTVPGVGTYSWIAAYSGDANNDPFATSCGDAHEVLTVTPASPRMTTVLSTEGFDIPTHSTSVTDTAALTGGFEPTGTIQFYVFFDSPTCVGSPVFTSDPIPVSGNGAYTSAPGFTPTQEGTYYWIAAYSGDANNNAFTTGCGDAHEVLTITLSPGTIIVEKVALGGDGTFGYTTTGGSTLPAGFDITTTGGAGSATFTGIDVHNTYSVAETSLPANWIPQGVSCSDGTASVDPTGFLVPAGGTVTCTFTNARLAQLIVIKDVDNSLLPAEAVAKSAGDFTMLVTAVSPSQDSFPGAESPGVTVYAEAGAFSVTEDPLNPTYSNAFYDTTYTATFSGCSGTLDWGETATCTITNTATAEENPNAHLVIQKVTYGGDGTFTFDLTGPSVGAELPATATITTSGGAGAFPASSIDILHGTYTITENAVAGWTLVSVTCTVNGGDPVAEANGLSIEVPLGGTVVCTFTNTLSYGQITDTVFCPFDVDTAVPGQQFNVLFQRSAGHYKISATNPGQFYYNVFFYGTPGDTATIAVDLPWPFVTQGAQPVHVYSGSGVTSSGCLLQDDDVSSTFTMSGPSTTSSGGPAIALGDYASQQNGQTARITLTGPVPSTGLAYVTVHIMWGLNGSGGWEPQSPCGGGCVADAKNADNGEELPNNFAYGFAWSESGTGTAISNSVNNKNVFKN